MRDPQEKPPDLYAELDCLTCDPSYGSKPQQWDLELFRVLKISILNHLATKN